MAMSSLNSIIYDTAFYGMSKFALHKIPYNHSHVVKNIDLMDLGLFAGSDFVYEQWLNKLINFAINVESVGSYKTINERVEKFAVISGMMAVLYYLLDEKQRAWDNIIAVGTGQLIQQVVSSVGLTF
jgi:hypothetical protein